MPKRKQKKTAKQRMRGVGSLSAADAAQLLALIQAQGGALGAAYASTTPAVEKRRHPKRRQPTYYRLRVDLNGAKPPIWRRLDLASDLTLDKVHVALQAAFDWAGGHLHEFRADDAYVQAERFLDEYMLEGHDGTPETDVRLDQVLHSPGDRLHYVYDFGDNWEHTLKLEEVAPRPASAPLARVVGGRRTAPPDDCGGIYGYQELIEALGDPTHPQHGEMSQWWQEYGGISSGRDFDPARLDLEQRDLTVQERLS